MDNVIITRLNYQKKKYIKIESRRMFNILLNMQKGENFKKNIPLNDLINDKVKGDLEQFKLYVGLIDDIEQYCKLLFNLDIKDCNITMNNSANEIMTIIQEKYLKN